MSIFRRRAASVVDQVDADPAAIARLMEALMGLDEDTLLRFGLGDPGWTANSDGSPPDACEGQEVEELFAAMAQVPGLTELVRQAVDSMGLGVTAPTPVVDSSVLSPDPHDRCARSVRQNGAPLPLDPA
jgi:hypothetical protein